MPLVESEGQDGDVVALRVLALVLGERRHEGLGLLGERLPRVVAEHVGEAPAAEAEAVFAAGLVEETVGAQVEGPARRQRYLDVAVVATALVAYRPARALEFLDLLAVAGVQRERE